MFSNGLPAKTETKLGSDIVKKQKGLKNSVILKINTYLGKKGSNKGMKRKKDYEESLKYMKEDV